MHNFYIMQMTYTMLQKEVYNLFVGTVLLITYAYLETGYS